MTGSGARRTYRDKELPDPGPPPYCPRCGGNKVAAPPNSRQGVCVGCGSHVRLLSSIEGHVLPFLQELSDLAVHPPPLVQLANQVRAKIRQEDELRHAALRTGVQA